MSEWQPIETAPKDGSKVDVGELNRWGWERVTDAHWDAPRGFWVHWGMSSFDRMDNVTVSIIPTHWMPPPPPPHNTNTK